MREDYKEAMSSFPTRVVMANHSIFGDIAHGDVADSP